MTALSEAVHLIYGREVEADVSLSGEQWDALCEAAEKVIAHDRRVTELLQANNELLERSRGADRQVKALRSMVGSLSRVMVKMVKMGGEWSDEPRQKD